MRVRIISKYHPDLWYSIGEEYDVTKNDLYGVYEDITTDRYIKSEDCIVIDKHHEQYPLTEDKAFKPDAHYDNTNGSLYKFAEDHKLNAWEFDIIKRLVRCRKKGQFKEDLEKTKRVIDLYLKEFKA